jgi:hypothetical protein
LKEDVQFNFNVKDRWGKTPVDEAVELGNAVIMQILGVDKKIDRATPIKIPKSRLHFEAKDE